MLFIFIAIVLMILFGLHFSIFFSMVNFFAVTSPRLKLKSALILGLMPIGFLATTIIAHRWDGTAIRGFYVFFSAWMGLASNLLFIILIAWAVILGGRVLDTNPPRLVIGISALVISLALSAFGVWNAFHPRVNEVSVKIKNLPPDWENKKAVQLTDMHLGYAFGPEFLDKIVDEVNRINPEVLFLTGDIFDGVGSELEDHVAPFKKINPPKGKFFITGNHESYLGTKKSMKALDGLGIEIINDRIVRLDGLQIVGAAYASSTETRKEQVINLLQRLNSEEPAIFLNHIPIYMDEAKKYGVDLQLSGHTHKGQLFPFGFITRAIFGPYHNGFIREGEYAIYTSPGTGAWGPPMRTGNRPEITVIRFLKDR